MKPGTRALGVAESFADGDDRSVLCGAVLRADRTADGFAFESCAVGGTDATAAIETLFFDLDREDVQYLLLAGIAPAWFNVVDLHDLTAAVDRPVLSVSFESSPGLESALRDQFSGDALDERLRTYRAQPPRRRLAVDGDDVWVRAVGVDADQAERIVRAYTPEGGRPEPLRVARLAARAARRFRAGGADGDV
ncbi:endonuclease dU [Haloplanus aerogenes]|uniref:UPF0215 protein ATH50_0882 n=1 Tax=Haloplanus aerogenes TaxID=660522 RepID=A0A3M0DP31_9EURY|nr:DUF99 family protein [Haloplanus aerogenes]AZH24683.1 DUF99 family protein [Haloplanus aerogenes]RMB23658.1 hypothetical protein ATH50_0882 [Haloplanus aerogenes]